MKTSPRLLIPASLLLAVTLALSLTGRAADVPAVPGAEGFGATTPRGRGGKILFVTTLDDAGPGSLRAACDAQGPRIVLFRVAGTIALKQPITVRNPFPRSRARALPATASACVTRPLASRLTM